MKKDTSKYNLEVGRRLFEQRKKLKLSRSYLGELVGLHETTVKRYEDGDIKSLGIDKINVFSDALNCSAAYLMGWDVDSEEINFNNTDEIYRLAAHGIGHDEKLSEEELARVKMAIRIALDKHNR